jgi:gamma-glutamylaminecyclotransferase
MCLIIHNPTAQVIPLSIIDTALYTNPDGFGIFFHDTGEIVKTMDWELPYDLMESGRPFTAHFRYATSGPVSEDNCHPFKIDDRFHLMMNGTIDRLKSDKTVDTKRLCNILKGLREKTILSILGTYACRFALLNTKNGTATVVNEDLWTERDGVLYSKANCFPADPKTSYPIGYKSICGAGYGKTDKYRGGYVDPWDQYADDWQDGLETFAKGYDKEEPKSLHTVAVYGTLKWGKSNHDHYLLDSHTLGGGVTNDPYPLIVDGLPYLIDRKGSGFNVEVEVYRVDDDTLDSLDALEGHPHWYQRKQIRIRLDKGGVVTAWCYLIPDKSPTVQDDGVYKQSYT